MGETPGKMYALAAVFSILPSVAVYLRFRARRKTKVGLKGDDWWILFALLATITTAALMVVGAALGNLAGHVTLGPHGVVNNERNQVFRLTTYANTITQLLALGPTKLSVLLFYRRIFQGRTFNIVSWTLMILVVIWTVAFFFSNLLVCVPIHSRVSTVVLAAQGETCIKTTEMFLAQSYADFSLDIFILIVPVPMIWNLHMPTHRKIQLSFIFLLGAVTTAASITRTAIQYRVGIEFDHRNPDTPSYLPPIVYWPLIESSLGIFAACLPTLRPLFVGWSLESAAESIRSSFSMDKLIRKSSRGSMQHGLNDAISLQSNDAEGSYKKGTYFVSTRTGQKSNVTALPISESKSNREHVPDQGILVQKAFGSENDV